MDRMSSALACVATALAVSVATAQEIPRVPVHFKAGTSSATVTRTLNGYESVDYILGAKAGQTMTVTMKTSNLSAYFNLLPPGSNDVAIFVGSSEGLNCKTVLPRDGNYAVRVYLMRNAARRGERADVALTFTITSGGSAAAPVGAFDKTLALLGISFHVNCPNDGPAPTLTVTPAHLAIDNSPMTSKVDGRVVDAEVADLDADGSPEVYVYIQGAGARGEVSIVAYAANRKKSLSGVFLPPVGDDAKAANGYRGGGDIAVVENRLVRRFPIYKDGDADGKPSGGTRQIQYRLTPGEAGWLLKPEGTYDY